ncbi:hypothetical protein BT67DRAFT_185582 [Trichocladium antarcticum]|uniref:Uncharacterized protein n=1 Tax=Trichocladium antarcticum TaxID=1450529 RepID=A0AAN6UPT4_9PEZI|nr:hypothetical protein BT67DRAFT_185582 [Trichocladium antarcticum]
MPAVQCFRSPGYSTCLGLGRGILGLFYDTQIYTCCPCVVSHQLPAVNNVRMLAGAWLLARYSSESRHSQKYSALFRTEDVHHPCNGGSITLLTSMMVCSQLLGSGVSRHQYHSIRVESWTRPKLQPIPKSHRRRRLGSKPEIHHLRRHVVRCCGDADLGFGGSGCVRRTRHTRSPAKAERDQS